MRNYHRNANQNAKFPYGSIHTQAHLEMFTYLE